jgi:hypothetical protein
MEVNRRLELNLLNIGSEIFTSVEDSTSAVIYKQFSIGNDHNTLNIGSAIDLFFNQAKAITL